MKKEFVEFYRYSKDEIKSIWDECLFVFDANSLLNLYRYPQTACKEFIDILSDKKISDRLWIPHQYAFEYQKNRLVVVAEQERSYSQLLDKIRKLIKDYNRHPFLDMNIVMGSAVEKIELAAGKHPKWNEEDDILDTITNLFAGKVGKPLSQAKLKEVYADGEIRIKKHIPPGYLDKDKYEEAKHGDLVGWKQIMEQAKSTKKPIVFITSEVGEDWWWEIKGNIIGPRYELTKEIRDYADVPLCMYDWKQFYEYAAEYLKRKVDEKIKMEIKEVTMNIIESGETKHSSSIEVAPQALGDVGRSSASQSSD